ncbi:hypothetical protein BpHYR1_026461 [Brachionus plicatilis]|uniref:Uncharacterized protein n=1 Tax=Brachionus plicatilis TaxID=10195 RepID=A0A3M7QWV7_BRAPC|nr:hypothetical protein BpHYR1_026461 [Brachionus plicatilis]
MVFMNSHLKCAVYQTITNYVFYRLCFGDIYKLKVYLTVVQEDVSLDKVITISKTTSLNELCKPITTLTMMKTCNFETLLSHQKLSWFCHKVCDRIYFTVMIITSVGCGKIKPVRFTDGFLRIEFNSCEDTNNKLTEEDLKKLTLTKLKEKKLYG